MKLPQSFYERTNVVKIARELLGKVLFTRNNGVLTGGMIVETEAYSWKERGCHAYQGRKTNRNEIMFANGGYSYVYRCYGIHDMFNVVTNRESIAEAVLIRALQPTVGQDVMQARRGERLNARQLTSGPGKLARALAIDRTLNAKSLIGDEIWIEDLGNRISPARIVATPRIGIDYAGDDAALPWRFYVKENRWVSR